MAESASGLILRMTRTLDATPDRVLEDWAWHEKDDFASPRGQESVVTIQFKAAGERTEMIFTQAVFKEEQARAAHNRGWTESFDKLGNFLRRAA